MTSHSEIIGFVSFNLLVQERKPEAKTLDQKMAKSVPTRFEIGRNLIRNSLDVNHCCKNITAPPRGR
jgi:hypothetical protein